MDGVGGEHVERLRLSEVRAPTLIASEHLHRYELAARLCDGLRVADVCCGTGYGTRILAEAGADAVGIDSSAEAIDEARAGAGGIREVRFEQADAHEFLARDLDSLDAVVMFEGLEHLPDPDRAVAALRRLGDSGVRLAVSIPNSEALGETGNPFHETDYDHETAIATLRALGDEVTILGQYLAEGSLIRGERSGGRSWTQTVLEGRAEPACASHYVGLVGFGDAAAEASARMLLAVAPAHRSYMLELEAANSRLWDRIGELEARLERIESSLPYRASAPLRALLRRRTR